MSDSKPSNHRLECPSCKTTHLSKDYSKHLNKEHEFEIFTTKSNKKELEELASKTNGRWFRPVEVKIKDKTLYYVPCCKKYYSRIDLATAHNKKKECTDTVLEEAKALLQKIAPITITNTHTGSGDIINNITQNITIVDLSGNVLKTIKQLVRTIDIKEEDRAINVKKANKLKKILEEHNIDYDSDVSQPLSYYGDDEGEDDMVHRYDAEDRCNKVIVKKFKEFGLDISRDGLELRTKDDHETEKLEKQQALKEEKEEIEHDIFMVASRIDSLESQIKNAKKRLAHLQEVPTSDQLGKLTLEQYMMTIQNDVNALQHTIKKYNANIVDSKIEMRELNARLSKL